MNIKTEVKALINEGYTEGELTKNPFWYIIWEPENIEIFNKEYEIEKYLLGYTAFGSSGGGELLVVDVAGTVYTVPAIGMEPQYAEKIAESISELKSYMEKNT